MASPLASSPGLVELIGDVDARTGQPDSAESLESVLAATERALDDALLPQRAPETNRSRMNTMWGGACG